MKNKNYKITIEFVFPSTIVKKIRVFYSLLRKDYFTYLINLFKLSVIYFSVTGLLLVKSYYHLEVSDAFITYWFTNRLAPYSYQCVKQYLILDEWVSVMKTTKTIKTELINSISDIKNLKKEIKLLQQSSENLKSMALPDSTEVEIKLKERQDAKDADYRFRWRGFWCIVGGSLIYEAVILWIFW